MIFPTNTPRGFHVETTWKQLFPRHFNVESTWCVCRVSCTEKNFINIDLKHLMFTDFFIMLASLFHSLMQNGKKEYLNCSVLEKIPLILFKLEDVVI